MEPTKICRVCRHDLPLTQFHKNKKSRDGRVNLCKECAGLQGAAYRASHKEKISQRTRERFASNASMKEKRDARLRQWQLENPDRYKYHQVRTSAKKKHQAFELSLEQFRELFWDKPCFYCDDPALGGIDRVNNEFGYTMGNCVPCCWECNKAKGSKSITELEGTALRLSKMVNRLNQLWNPSRH